MKQLALDLRTWGGKRRGAGRPPKGKVALVSHDRRPGLDGRTPVHVVLRVLGDVPNLRAKPTFEVISGAFRAAKIRLTHFSVQGNHLHLIVEARSKQELSRGMQSLAIRIARAVNRAAGRTGRVFADHYFGHPLRTPTEVRHAIDYVLNNRARHLKQPKLFDPLASTLREPQFWLLRIGWRRGRGEPRWHERVPL